MDFNTVEFILFLFFVFIIYFSLGNSFKNPFLIIASYIFYGLNDYILVPFLVVFTLVNYYISIKLYGEDKKKKSFLTIGIIFNLGLLLFYKYNRFGLELVKSISHGHLPMLESIFSSIVIPIGITIITMQAISYLVDIYRGYLKVEKNFLNFALFISFFPKIVKGPIENNKTFLNQLYEEHKFDMQRFRTGSMKVLWGFFLRMVVADRLAKPINEVYGSIETQPGIAIVIATILFALEFYFDYYGYYSIAVGTAEILGFKLKNSFAQPYFSTTISEFWSRWHTSISKWLKDYVYVPLGGSRINFFLYSIVLLITYGLFGLVYGAGSGFLIWGLLNGIIVIIDRAYRIYIRSKRPREKRKMEHPLIRRIIIFLLFSATLIFFRSIHLENALKAINQIVGDFGASRFLTSIKSLGDLETKYLGFSLGGWIYLFIFVFIAAYVDWQMLHGDFNAKIANERLIIRWPAFFFLIFAIIIFGVYGPGYHSSEFIFSLI